MTETRQMFHLKKLIKRKTIAVEIRKLFNYEEDGELELG